jgi:dTDP-glucose 4,6-dehydratase
MNKVLKNFEIISGDIRDYDILSKHIKKVDVIFHLAALIGIPYSYVAVKSYIETNINGTFNILNLSKNTNIKKIILTSTSEVYGSAQKIPILETHPLNAQSPYAATKIAADQLGLSFYKSYGLPVTILRPFNTFGPRQSARAIIPTIISQILYNKKKIKLGNLSPTRDFTYVDDTVNAFVKTLKNNLALGEIINIGNNFEVSVNEIINIIKKDFGYDFQVLIEDKRKRTISSEVNRLFASNRKASKILKWSPKMKGLEGFKLGLRKTIEWFSNPKNLRHYNPNIYNI